MKKTRALFLDRDGIIDHMILYKGGWDSPQKSEDVKLINGIEKIIKWANGKNIPVIEVSNQPGVAKGKISQKTSDAIEKKIHRLLKEGGAFIDKVYVCPHHPKAVVPKLKIICDCRKPKPGLLLRAANELDIDLSNSLFLGDKASDAEAGKLAEVKTIIYLHREDEQKKVEEAENANADFKTDSMKKSFKTIKEFFK